MEINGKSNGIEKNSQQKSDETNSEAARDLSLTDHLNKRLLDSYLQQLNDRQPLANNTSSAADDINNDFEDDKPPTD